MQYIFLNFHPKQLFIPKCEEKKKQVYTSLKFYIAQSFLQATNWRKKKSKRTKYVSNPEEQEMTEKKGEGAQGGGGCSVVIVSLITPFPSPSEPHCQSADLCACWCMVVCESVFVHRHALHQCREHSHLQTKAGFQASITRLGDRTAGITVQTHTQQMPIKHS